MQFSSYLNSQSTGSSGVIPLVLSVPARSTAGQTNGSVTIIDAYTARINLKPAMSVPDQAIAYLQTASFPYSFPNVASAGTLLTVPAGNNRVTITFGASPAADYYIPTGLYGFTDVAFALNQIAVTAGWSVNPYNLFTLQGVASTQTIIMTLNPAALTGGTFPVGGMTISFVNPSPVSGLSDSMGNLLGFGSIALTTATGSSPIVYQGSSPANFATQTAYIANLSIVKDSYLNGSSGSALYSFPLGGQSTNSVVEYSPSLKYEVPLTSGKYSTIDLWFTDQSGARLALVYFDGPISLSMTIRRAKQQ